MSEKLKDLAARKEIILERQLELAREFYAIDPNDIDSKEKHRQVTLEMTKNAIDLILPQWVEQIKNGVNKIAMVAPLRGGLGMVNRETENHLRHRLGELGYGDVEVEKWAIGVKRNAAKESAEVYFRQGYLGGKNCDYSKTLVGIFDWGCATGATIVDCSREIRKFTGIGFEKMSAVVMTVSQKAQDRITHDCGDETGAVGIFGSTRARINNVGYVDGISTINTRSTEFNVTPKDWGDQMWGAFDTDNKEENMMNISRFVESFCGVFGDGDYMRLSNYYMKKYVTEEGNY